MHLLALLWLSPAWAQVENAPAPQIIDRIMVVVDQRVITASDLELSMALDAREDVQVVGLSGPTDDAMARLINRRVLFAQAGSVGVYQPTEAETRSRMARLKSQWPALSEAQQFMQRHGLDDAQLMRTLSERMVVERYIRRNLPGKNDQGPTAAEFQAWMTQQRRGVRIRRANPMQTSP